MRILDENVRQVCDTCCGRRQIRKLLGQDAAQTHKWVSADGLDCCVQACMEIHKNTNKEKRLKCTLSGKRSTTSPLPETGRECVQTHRLRSPEAAFKKCSPSHTHHSHISKERVVKLLSFDTAIYRSSRIWAICFLASLCNCIVIRTKLCPTSLANAKRQFSSS